jgi:ATP/maltotriose-dependent transcriptional regulator MalT
MLSFLHDHLVLEGLAYRVSPTATGQQVDVERLYDNIMHRFRYGGLNKEGIYVDEDVKRMANTHQLVMGILIDSLLQQGDLKRALSVCQKWQKEMPSANVPYTDSALSMARCYYLASQPEKGDAIVSNLLSRSVEWLSWIDTITPWRRNSSIYSQYEWQQTMQKALIVAEQFKRTKLSNQYIKQYEHFIK